MIYLTGGLTDDNRGSIGGITFSRNKSGAFARARTKGTNPRTQKQMSVRGYLASYSSLFKTLSLADKATWTALAALFPRVNKLGQTYFYSAQQMYNYINSILVQNGQGRLDTAPDIELNVVPSYAPISAAIQTTPGNEDILFNLNNSLGINYIGIIYSTGVISGGNPQNHNYKFLEYFDSTFIPGASIKESYQKVFGLLPSTGQWVNFKFLVFDKTAGWRNVPQICSAVGTL